jgi:hypothetical protein
MPCSQPGPARRMTGCVHSEPRALQRAAHPPPRDVLLWRQGQREVQQHAQLGVVAAQAAHAVPPLPRVRRVVRACACCAVGASRLPPACPKRPGAFATTGAHALWQTWACLALLRGRRTPHAQSTHPSTACKRLARGGTQACWHEQVMVRRPAREREADQPVPLFGRADRHVCQGWAARRAPSVGCAAASAPRGAAKGMRTQSAMLLRPSMTCAPGSA